ncbi:hypothetical protein [uncultured Abyssibacter sp.]|uniref:hypothetical protein n=1 Tax=uncultured Abyssibacter sp. TaxID=2320202 RepID=UPI0032B30951
MPVHHTAVRAVLTAALIALASCADEGTPASDTPPVQTPDETPPESASTVESRFPGVRTLPDITCPEDYVGTTGLVQSPPEQLDIGDYDVFGGELAPEDIAASLPRRIYLKGQTENYTRDYYFAIREGNIYFKPNLELTGVDEPWKILKLPRCLEGEVSEISADGYVLLALNANRDIYTLDYNRRDYGINPWTRRWGPFFWTDLGGYIPDDVHDWAASELHSGVDEYFIDGGGRPQKPWGILTVYLLRGDGRHITYLDPWLPMDESREVCGPERGTVSIAGLAGSGSTVMVITNDGEIYTRLYEFDISGANTFLLDYSWQDQDDVDDPLIQLPAPGWIHHPRVPGSVTDRLSLRKLSPGTEHRVMRIEGTDANGQTGYWEKDLADLGNEVWRFTITGEDLLGRSLPLETNPIYPPEDFRYEGMIDGMRATVDSFNPYCSPTTLRIEFAGQPLELVLHSSDGLRQERRARGLDLYPRYYRGAVEIPVDVFDNMDALPTEQQDFLRRHFGEQRFLEGPLLATRTSLQILQACWNLSRPLDDLGSVITQPPVPDAGSLIAEIFAEQEQGRTPPLCLGLPGM